LINLHYAVTPLASLNLLGGSFGRFHGFTGKTPEGCIISH